MKDLVESFIWASSRARSWVQTGRDAAYLPSYWAGLPERPMFYSRDLAHQMLGAHLLGLDTENLAMLRHFAASATERRGWYPLWAFEFTGEPAAIDYRSDDDFVRETPAPFELVEKAVEQFRWTGDDRFLRTPEIAAFIRSTTTVFVETHDPLGTGVAGTASNKDFFAGIATYNEVEEPPYLQVAGDGIASQWAAYESLKIENDLREHFERDWWLPGERHYAAGFTADGPVTGFRKESSWFPAVKGLIRKNADAHLEFLSDGLRDDPPHNIEAYTYLPEAFLRYGWDAQALRWIRHLAASRSDYPEVSFTHVAHVAVGLTGLEPGDNPGEVRTRSHLPGGDWLEADGIPLAGSVLGVRHEGREASELWVTDGPGVTWTAFEGTTVHVPSGSRVRAYADGRVEKGK
ncbi:hypothetical protein ACQP2X_15775 [Actinoplanes sp. CA-131856]